MAGAFPTPEGFTADFRGLWETNKKRTRIRCRREDLDAWTLAAAKAYGQECDRLKSARQSLFRASGV